MPSPFALADAKHKINKDFAKATNELTEERNRIITNSRHTATVGKLNKMFHRPTSQASFAQELSKNSNEDTSTITEVLAIRAEKENVLNEIESYQDKLTVDKQRSFKELDSQGLANDPELLPLDHKYLSESAKISPKIQQLSTRVNDLNQRMDNLNIDKEKESALFTSPIPQNLKKSLVYENAVTEFRESKNRLANIDKDLEQLKVTKEHQENQVAKNPPLTLNKVDVERIYKDDFDKTANGKILKEKIASAKDTLQKTSGYINNLHEKAELFDKQDHPLAHKISSKANHLSIQRALMLGKARGVNPVEAIKSYKDPYLSSESREKAIKQLSDLKKFVDNK